MVPSGPTMKSPLISGLRHTTTRMESPGAREIVSDTAGGAVWDLTTREHRADAARARGNDNVRKFRITLFVGDGRSKLPHNHPPTNSASRAQELCPYRPSPSSGTTLRAKAMYLNWFGSAPQVGTPG